jgi:hypothetical protein
MDGAGSTYYLDTTTVTPASVTQPMVVSAYTTALAEVSPGGGRPVETYNWSPDDFGIRTLHCGVIDPANPARFTCEFATGAGRHHSIEGLLSAAGNGVVLRYITPPGPAGDLPAGPGPVAAPAVFGPIASPTIGR